MSTATSVSRPRSRLRLIVTTVGVAVVGLLLFDRLILPNVAIETILRGQPPTPTTLTGTIENVQQDRSGACLRTEDDKQVCGYLHLPPDTRLNVGQVVTVYRVTLPEKGEAWVGLR
jgi:hypothetical protein